MTWRLVILIVLLTPLIGCSEDSHKPRSGELGLSDLRLTATVSADEIVIGDTLDIDLIARNPYGRPIDVTFPDGCREGFWIYDSQGTDVSPPYKCTLAVSHLHMDSLEVREFDQSWVACGVAPGYCTVVAGFRAPLEGSPHTARSIRIRVLPSDEDVTGVWTGAFLGVWRDSVWGDQHFALTIEHDEDLVSGTLSVGESMLRIDNGLLRDNQIAFSVSHDAGGFTAEFTGDVCRNRMSGPCHVYDTQSRELLEDMYWHVWKEE
jgi:hypothetical protein